MKPKFETIMTKTIDHYDYSTLETWEASLESDSDTIHIGVLGADDEVQDRLSEFIDRKEYRYSYCDFILITESGEILASYIDEQWEIHTEDIKKAFRKPIESPDNYQRVAFEFIKERFDELDTEFDRSEVQQLIQVMSQKFAEIIATNPAALDELEWRDIERLLAEVFDGIGFSIELTPPSKDGGKDIILQCVVSGKKHSYIVEVKHWRSSTKVGGSAIKDFLSIIVNENRDAGLFLSTYGYTSNAFEGISEIERHRIRFGKKEKVVSLCKTYVDSASGLVVPPDLLPTVLFNGTING